MILSWYHSYWEISLTKHRRRIEVVTLCCNLYFDLIFWTLRHESCPAKHKDISQHSFIYCSCLNTIETRGKNRSNNGHTVSDYLAYLSSLNFMYPTRHFSTLEQQRVRLDELHVFLDGIFDALREIKCQMRSERGLLGLASNGRNAIWSTYGATPAPSDALILSRMSLSEKVTEKRQKD
jgi:hypothetical protein